MKIGTPGFKGRRLSEAREARGLSVVALSELISVTPASIYQFQKDEASPSDETLTKIADVLNFPILFFSKEDRVDLRANLLFRSYASAAKYARDRLRIKFNWSHEIAHFLLGHVDFPELNLPDWKMDFASMDEADIEQAAMDLRNFWGLGDGPISDISILLENNGITIATEDVGVSDIDAVSGWALTINRPIMILGRDKKSTVRSRFSALHEVFHLLFHKGIDQALVREDKEFLKFIDDQANRFASAFLFPAESFKKETFTVSLEELKQLKPKWKMAIQAMLFRAADLGLISPIRRVNLWKNLSRRGWRTDEPYDDSIPFENPYILSDSLNYVVESGPLGRGAIRDALLLPTFDVEKLTNVPAGFLADEKQGIKPKVIEDWQSGS